MADLRDILDNETLQESLLTLVEVRLPVGSGAYPQTRGPHSLSFDTGDRDLELFQQDLALGASGGLEVQIAAATAAVDNLFDTGETAVAPDGQSFSHVNLHLGAQVRGKSTLATEPLSLTFTGSADGGFAYQHLLPVARSERRVDALLENLRGFRLPGRLDPRELLPGEVHRFDARFNLDLGLKLTWGFARDVSRTFENLFDGLSPAVQAQATASLEAAVGWSLNEELLGVLGRSNMLNEGWARLRLQRKHQSRLSFGAMVALEVNYNLADALDSILRRAFDLTPLPRVVSALEEVKDLGSAEDLREKLSERAADAVADYLDDTGWRDKLNDSNFVTDLVNTADEVVSAYDSLNDQVRSWWDDLLGRVGLEADSTARQVLERLSRLNGTDGDLDLSRLLDPEERNTVEILEALSGRSLEDLLLGGNEEFKDVLRRVSQRAREALAFLKRLDEVGEVPGQVLERIQNFAQKTGIEEVLDFLARNATSKAQLEDAIATQAQNTIQGLVSRLTDKVFGEVTDEEVQRIRSWAQGILDQYQSLRGKVRDAIDKTRGRFGFSLSLAVDRATRRQAWIDVEFDPRHAGVRRIVRKALERGSPRVLLEELPQEDPDTGEAPPFQIREAVLSFHRSRAASVILSSLGMQVLGTRGERIDEYTIRLEQAARDKPIQREARFSGGYLRTQIHGSAEVRSAAWLDSRADEEVAVPLAPFRDLDHSLRLTLAWNDPATTPTQVKALQKILRQLGFTPLPGRAENAVEEMSGAGVPTRFSLELRLPGATVPATLAVPEGASGEAAWDLDYLRTGRRWYAETLNPDVLARPRGISIGAALGWVLQQPDFLDRWTAGVNTFTDWAQENGKFGRVKNLPGTDGRQVNLTLIEHPGLPNRIARWDPEFNSLAYFLVHRRLGLAGFRKLATHFVGTGSATRESLARQSHTAADTFRRAFATAPLDTSSWTNPTFHFWLVLARLARIAPDQLGDVEGLYSFRWRGPSDTDEWQDPVIQRLKEGLNPDLLKDAFGG